MSIWLSCCFPNIRVFHNTDNILLLLPIEWAIIYLILSAKCSNFGPLLLCLWKKSGFISEPETRLSSRCAMPCPGPLLTKVLTLKLSFLEIWTWGSDGGWWGDRPSQAAQSHIGLVSVRFIVSQVCWNQIFFSESNIFAVQHVVTIEFTVQVIIHFILVNKTF